MNKETEASLRDERLIYRGYISLVLAQDHAMSIPTRDFINVSLSDPNRMR